MAAVLGEVHGLDDAAGVGVVLQTAGGRALGEGHLQDAHFPQAEGGFFGGQSHVDFNGIVDVFHVEID